MEWGEGQPQSKLKCLEIQSKLHLPRQAYSIILATHSNFPITWLGYHNIIPLLQLRLCHLLTALSGLSFLSLLKNGSIYSGIVSFNSSFSSKTSYVISPTMSVLMASSKMAQLSSSPATVIAFLLTPLGVGRGVHPPTVLEGILSNPFVVDVRRSRRKP